MTSSRRRGPSGSSSIRAPIICRRLIPEPSVGQAPEEPRPAPKCARHLGDQVGVARGFVRDGRPLARRIGPGFLEHDRGQSPGVVRVQRADIELAHRCAARGETVRVGQGLQAGILPLVLAAIAGQQQQSRRGGTAEQFREHLGAIQVAPLEVVDPEDERMAPADRRQELLERAERPSAQLRRVGRQGQVLCRRRDRTGPLEDREHPRQRPDIAR